MEELKFYDVASFGKSVVNARELHQYLQIKSSFASWYNRYIHGSTVYKEYTDYVSFTSITNEFSCAISRGVAKDLSIIAGNDAGKKAVKSIEVIDKLFNSTNKVSIKATKKVEPKTVDTIDVWQFEGLRYKRKGDDLLLSLLDIALGLGFVDKSKGTNKVRWSRVKGYLAEFDSATDGATINADTYVSESMFYMLAMKASSAKAKEFQLKVATVILPQIRKTGGYIPIKSEDTDEEIVFKALNIMQATIAKKDALLLEQKPKVDFHDKLMSSDTAISIGQFAKMLRIGPNALFSKLREDDYLMSGYKTKNTPYQRYIDNGYFELKETVVPIGNSQVIKLQTLVTPKGQQALTPKYYVE